jgi:hypothetical protein
MVVVTEVTDLTTLMVVVFLHLVTGVVDNLPVTIEIITTLIPMNHMLHGVQVVAALNSVIVEHAVEKESLLSLSIIDK